MEPVVAELRAKKKCSFSTLVPSPMIANPGYLRSSWCTRGFRSEMSATVSGTPRSMWGPFWWGGSSTASWRPSSPRGCLSPSQGRLIGPWGTLEDSWPPPAPGNFAQPPAHFCLKWKFRNSAQSPSGVVSGDRGQWNIPATDRRNRKIDLSMADFRVDITAIFAICVRNLLRWIFSLRRGRPKIFDFACEIQRSPRQTEPTPKGRTE